MNLERTPVPAEFLPHLRALIAAGRDLEALEYASLLWPAVAPHLTAAELDVASGLLEGAEMAVDLAQRDAAVPAAHTAVPEP
jgi:hypothetical protein